ncbi:MAG: hypothetical protein V1873_03490 [Verrucomicrobiota bacterium]
MSSEKYSRLCIAALALLASLAFCFLVFPDVSVGYHAVLDPDGLGRLGLGLWKYGTVSYFPDDQPSVSRGPLYPVFLAALLALTNGWWPGCAQVGQCILFAATCWLAGWMASRLWGRGVGFLTSLACAIHPFLVWYTSRILVEVVITFLFTALLAAMLLLALSPGVRKALLVGLILGLCILAKSTFLPYVLWVPLALAVLKPRKIPGLQIILIPILAVAVVLPWTARNWVLTGKVIPVHVLAGAAALDGDAIVTHFGEAPFSLGVLGYAAGPERKALAAGVPPQITGPAREWYADMAMLKTSLRRHAQDPAFLVRKVAMNAVLFWTLGETKQKSAVIGLLLVPLVLLFIPSCVMVLRERRTRTFEGTCAALLTLYYLSLLPVDAVARYSMPLVPALIMYSAGLTRFWLKEAPTADRVP